MCRLWRLIRSVPPKEGPLQEVDTHHSPSPADTWWDWMPLHRELMELVACGSGYTADEVIDLLLSTRGDGLTEFRLDAAGCLHNLMIRANPFRHGLTDHGTDWGLVEPERASAAALAASWSACKSFAMPERIATVSQPTPLL